MSWEAVAGLSGLVAALVAIVALILQTRQAAFVAGVDLLFNMYERFFSAEMLANRRRAALGLMGTEPSAADDVLNFFEIVGLLTRRKALDDRMVWHMLSGCIVPYVNASEKYITASRQTDKTIWSAVVWLAERMQAIERKHGGAMSAGTGPRVDEFLKTEAEVGRSAVEQGVEGIIETASASAG